VASGLGFVTRPQLGRMVDSVIGGGAVSGADAEAASWALVGAPGRVWGPTGTLAWWGFTDPGLARVVDPWSRAERAAITACRVTLDSAAAAVGRADQAWRRAILSASNKVILVTPRAMAGELAALHPVWQDIVWGSPEREIAAITVDVSAWLDQPVVAFAGRRITRRRLEPLDPPGAIEQWPVLAGILRPLSVESPTALEALFGCRLAWTLRHAARIRAGDLIGLPTVEQMIGTLAHAVVADLLGDPSRALPRDIEGAAQAKVEQLLQQVAAPLALPELVVERQRALASIPRAVRALAELLAVAGLAVEGCEVERQATVDGFILSGRMDLVAARRDGLRVILDLKWSGTDRIRRDEIAEDRAVQLASYVRLERERTGSPAEAGYFMLRQARVLWAGAMDTIGEASLAPVPLEATWRKILAARQHVLDELAEGHVAAEGDRLVDKEVAAERPLPGLIAHCDFCPYGRLCGVARLT
jgi:hypothetical protein